MKKIGERSEPSNGLGRGKGRHPSPFDLPRLALGSLSSPNFFSFAHADFFSFFSQCGAWSQATTITQLFSEYRYPLDSDLYLVDIPVQRLNNRA